MDNSVHEQSEMNDGFATTGDLNILAPQEQ